MKGRNKGGNTNTLSLHILCFKCHERILCTCINMCPSQASVCGCGSGEPTMSAGMHRCVAFEPNVNSHHRCVHASLLESCFPFLPGAQFCFFRLLFCQLAQMQSHHKSSYTNTPLESPACSQPLSKSTGPECHVAKKVVWALDESW